MNVTSFSGKLVMKKWANARDNWIRCAKKLKEYKSGTSTKSVTIYKFYEQMLFLNKIVSHRPISPKKPLFEYVEESRTADKHNVAVPKKKKKKYLTEDHDFDGQTTSLVNSVEREDNSRIMSFFRGIAPTIEKFNEDDIVEFQYEVIKTMRNISQRSQSQR